MTVNESDNPETGIDENIEEQANEAPTETGLDKDQIIAALESEVGDMKDRVLRAVAEMENLRKRTQREVSEARSYAIADFARDMLTATDNLERALMAVPQEVRDAADPSMKSLIEGIEMTEREMQRLMQKNGVKPILAEGEKFDPHKHQAMFEVPNDQVPSGTVVQVMQAGFEIGDRVLRPAMVGVSKGGPKAAPRPQTDPAPKAANDAGPAEGEHIDKEV